MPLTGDHSLLPRLRKRAGSVTAADRRGPERDPVGLPGVGPLRAVGPPEGRAYNVPLMSVPR
jgi:hypothetical protein